MNLMHDAGAGMSKILIVDDSPTQLYSLRQIVESGGHQTLTAESAEKALELAADEKPEVILMDIVMPGMSGYQAKRKDGEADRVWGLRQGAREYVTKPVNPTILLTAISEAMAA